MYAWVLIYPRHCKHCLLDYSHPKRCFLWFLIYISLMTNNVKLRSVYWSIVDLLWRNVYLNPCSKFLIGLWGFVWPHTWHAGVLSSLTRDWIYAPCSGKSPNHWTASKAPSWVVFLLLSFNNSLYILDTRPLSTVFKADLSCPFAVNSHSQPCCSLAQSCLTLCEFPTLVTGNR